MKAAPILKPFGKRAAEAQAAKLAADCYDINGGAMVRIEDPLAVKLLAQAFTLLLRKRGRPIALPVAPEVAKAFPRHVRRSLPVGIWCLAVGIGRDGRACFSLQAAHHPDAQIAQAAARTMAMAKLGMIGMTSGFPVGPTRGQA